jgi:ATP-dependent helicase HrpB
VVLATSIAETSLTIEGVRIVVDSGVARVPRYEPDIGLTRLENRARSRAAVDQRRGRAGRTEPGVCYRLWDEPQTASLAAYTQPEILSADLSSLVLDLAQWGSATRHRWRFSIRRRAGAEGGAKSVARTRRARCRRPHHRGGQQPARLALPPRLARMIVDSHRLGAAEQPRKLPPCSPSAGSAATASISMPGSINSAAIARRAPAARGARGALGRAGRGEPKRHLRASRWIARGAERVPAKHEEHPARGAGSSPPA